MRRRRHLEVGDAVLLGAVAGVAGGVAMMLARPLEERGLLSPGRRRAPEWERFVRSVAARRGVHLTRRQTRALGAAMHLLYSAAIGAGYGAVRTQIRLPDALQGTLTGALAYLAGYPEWGLMPQVGASRPVRRQSPRRALIPVGTHAIFGMVVAESFKLLERHRLAA